MNFICEPCKEASTVTTLHTGTPISLVKQFFHNKCKGGTFCDCQHRVGANK